jgi:hypothetical protein
MKDARQTFPEPSKAFFLIPPRKDRARLPSPSHNVDELNLPRRTKMPKHRSVLFDLFLFLRAPNFMQWMLCGLICPCLPLQGLHRSYSSC